jgi:transposase
MTMGRVEVITSVERRRRWSLAEKERLVAASLEPGVSASAVARAAGIHVSQLFSWRKALCRREEPRLVPVVIAASETTAAPGAEVAATCSATGEPEREMSEMAAVAPNSPSRRGRRRAGLMEIELERGRRLRVDRDVDADALARVLDVLGRR